MPFFCTGMDMDIRLMVPYIVDDSPVGQHNSFGFSGRAGSINHICQVICVHRNGRPAFIRTCKQFFYIHGFRVFSFKFRCRNDDRSLAVFCNLADSVCRIIRVAGNIRAPCLHYAVHSCDKPAVPVQQDGRLVPSFKASCPKSIGNPVHAGIQFPVA